MNTGSVYLLLLTFSLGILPFVAVWQATNLAHSKYRSRLWQLRDRLVEDLLEDRLDRNPTTEEFLSTVEASIRLAKRHGYLDLLLASRMLRNTRIPALTEEFLPSGLGSEQRKLLSTYLNEFVEASMSHLLWGSISGWIAGLVFWLKKSIRRSRGNTASRDLVGERTTVVEVTEMPQLLWPPKKKSFEFALKAEMPFQ